MDIAHYHSQTIYHRARMRSFHLLASLATAFSLVQAADYKTEATVIIFALNSDRENVIVTAKDNSEAPITDLISTSDHGWCRSTLGLDPVTGECAEPEWAVITSLRFARPTDKPRPVLVRYPDYTIEVSLAIPSTG